MGHHITGLLARTEVFARLSGALAAQPHYPLAEGLSFLPLDQENLDGIVGLHNEAAVDQFVYLTPTLLRLVSEASHAGELAYIETEYHGGVGGQGAVVARDAGAVFGPIWKSGQAINEALAFMGVQKKPGEFDAFATIGLPLHRSNDSFRRR